MKLFKVEVVMVTKTGRKILCVRLYQDFQNAFSDVIDKNADLHAYLDDIGVAIDPAKPVLISAGSVMPNGYGDDFVFHYPNGILINLGTAVISDEETS